MVEPWMMMQLLQNDATRLMQSGYVDIYTKGPPPSESQRIKLNNTTPFTPKYVVDNLTRSSDPSQTYSSRVQGRKILLDNPEQESKARKERIAKRIEQVASRASAGVIGKREARQKRLWRLSAVESKFRHFLPLHYLWLDYMSELLNLPPESHMQGVAPNTSNIHAKIVKADFHGSILTVRQSKNPCLVGLSGIVVHETENTFKVVTQKDQLKLVPKPHSIFIVSLPLYSTITPTHDMAHTGPAVTVDTEASTPSLLGDTRKSVLDMPRIELDLYGNQFCFRAYDRASKKFKSKETIEL